jgi:transcription elongation factor Elf1
LTALFLARICWFCAAEDAMYLRFDKKKHRPFLACEVCGSHCFLRTPQALTGLAIVTPLIEEMHRRMHADAGYAEEQRQAIVAFQLELLAAMQPPTESEAARATGATFRDTLEQSTKRKV